LQRPAEGGEQAQEGHGRARRDVPAVQQHQCVPGGQQHHDDEDQRGHEARVAPVLSRGRVAVGPGHFEHPVDRCDRRPREDLGLHGAQGLGDRVVQRAVELPLIGRHPAEPSGVRRHRPPEECAEDQRHQQQLRADQGDEDQGHQRPEHHLDELPQLWNVFKGDMSFIGPRPERRFYIEQIMAKDARYEQLYALRPGVTSYATLYNGYADSIEKMLKRLELDLYYLQNRSWWMDTRILACTFFKIAGGKKF